MWPYVSNTDRINCAVGVPSVVYDKRRDYAYCPTCGEESEIFNSEMSYAFKLLLDEMKSLCMSPKLRLSDRA